MLRSGMRRRLRPLSRYLLATLAVATSAACASIGAVPDRQSLDDAIRTRAGHGLSANDGTSLPPGVSIEADLTPDDAVAVALWNSPSFQATLADLGVARADLIEAGLLRNPILSLLLPVGPRQLEYVLQFPAEALWQRPRRVAAASLDVQSVGQRLVWDALSLVAQVRTTHAEAVIGATRLDLAAENAILTSRLAAITDARWRAGDISELETRAARADAGRAEAARVAAAHDRDVARLTLANLLGLDVPADRLRPTGAATADLEACGTEDARLAEALASRPDIRAAELGIDAAAARARWERSRVATLIAALDRNATGHIGPRVIGELPIFWRNQGAIGRAEVEIERASRQYAAVRAQVALDVRAATVRMAQARGVLDTWQTQVLPSLEIEVRQAESAYTAGEIPLFVLLDASRRLIDARMRRLDADADLQRATIALERSIGRTCAPR